MGRGAAPRRPEHGPRPHLRLMPPASTLLRLLGFTVPAALSVAALQPLLGSLAGQVPSRWAIGLSIPCIAAAGILVLAARLADIGELSPPWYSAWILLPGAFLLAGSASMCIFGALVQVRSLPQLCWSLLIAGAAAWVIAMALVRRASR